MPREKMLVAAPPGLETPPVSAYTVATAKPQAVGFSGSDNPGDTGPFLPLPLNAADSRRWARRLATIATNAAIDRRPITNHPTSTATIFGRRRGRDPGRPSAVCPVPPSYLLLRYRLAVRIRRRFRVRRPRRPRCRFGTAADLLQGTMAPQSSKDL